MKDIVASLRALPLSIIRYCAEEVERQQDSPMAVGWMCEAWAFAYDQHAAELPLTTALIECVGMLVHPEENPYGFRRVAVRVGDHLCPDWQEIPPRMAKWVAALNAVTPEEAYREFQEIHPFRDGNGRTGKILYNWLAGTLDAPKMPPNFFGGANP